MPRIQPTSIRLPPKIKAGLQQIADSRKWHVSQAIVIACEEMIGRYLFGKKIRVKRPKGSPSAETPAKNDTLDFTSQG